MPKLKAKEFDVSHHPAMVSNRPTSGAPNTSRCWAQTGPYGTALPESIDIEAQSIPFGWILSAKCDHLGKPPASGVPKVPIKDIPQPARPRLSFRVEPPNTHTWDPQPNSHLL